jgi:hypothetical protein
MEDEAIRLLITRLSRPHGSGGRVVGRAAILAEGADSGAILAWIDAHDGRPEEVAAAPAGGGLHGARMGDGARPAGAAPRRYVLPPGALG